MRMLMKYRVLFLVLLLLAVVGCKQGKGSLSDSSYGEAVSLFNQKQYTKARLLFEELAEQNHAEANNYLGKIYKYGLGVDRDYKISFQYYKKSSELGCAAAMTNLGSMYLSGSGVEKSCKEYVKWYSISAESGFPLAIINLALSYIEGGCVSVDYSKAEYYLDKIDKESDYYNKKIALEKLYGLGRNIDSTSALKMIEQIAAQDDIQFMLIFAKCLRNGVGKRKNLEQAREVYIRASLLGSATAQYNLAVMIFYGHGGDQDYQEAFKWAMASAVQNDDKAQEMVGVMYLKGLGVEKDRKEGIAWLVKSSQRGNARASSILKSMQ